MDRFIKTPDLPEIRTRNVNRFEDGRGTFQEIVRSSDLPETAIEFLQDSVSISKKRVLRGMHFQESQWQLVTLLKGSILDVILCVDKESVNFQKYVCLNLTEDGTNQLFIPPGFAHGFANLGEEAVVHYKSSVHYGATKQHGVHWQSRVICHLWPKHDWVISQRDCSFAKLEFYEC